MKTMKLLPLKIAVTSAMIVGLGVASTANAQAQSELLESLQKSIENQGDVLTKQKKNSATTLQKQRLELNKFKGYVLHSQQTHALITEAINDSVEDLYDITDDLYEATGDLADDIAKNKADIQNNIDNIYDLAQQQDRHAYDIQNLAKAQLAGVEVMKELDNNVKTNAQKIDNIKSLYDTQIRTWNKNDESIKEHEKSIKEHKDAIAKNNDSIDDLYEANAENVERLTQVDNNVFVNRLNIQELERKQENDIKDVIGMQNAIAEQADKNKNDIQDLAKAQLAGVGAMEELNKNVEENKANIAANKADADANFETLTKNQNALIEQDEAINQELEGFAAHADVQDQNILQNQADIAANKADADANFETLTKNQNALIEQDEAINQELEGFAAHADVQDQNILQNQADIAANKADADANFETLTKNQNALIEQDEAINQELEGFAAHADVQDQNILQNQADIAANKADANAKFKGVQTDIAINKITLAQHAKKIDDNQQAIEAKLGGKADLQKLSELKTSVDKNQADIQLHDQKINNLGILHTMVARAVGNNTQGVATNKADIAKNNESIEDLYEANAENVERLTQVDNNVFVNRLNIQELKRKQENDIKDVVGMQNAIAEQADKNKNHIQDLAKAQLAGVEVMDELNKNVEKNKADADANFETLTKNQNALIEKDKEHDKLITANKTAIDANKASADAKFAATTDALTKHGQDITKNAKSITDLGTKVNGFDGRISALDTKVNGFDGRISALDTKVNAFDGRITALDSKVENGMASQAALSGLFQPYSVGKFNATAALGGYGSKSAVAIGAGYRVNPNLAFKAGAAINTSGDKKGSYNIGVNYEF
uniref:Ubiquitous surface protein A2 n=1 Tax=Moraxella catarrhalis TaxID=480 RepID=M4QGG0_MORCA|nr:ubiquitous surface protein A2 precursor [Moraxella catarrhalis]